MPLTRWRAPHLGAAYPQLASGLQNVLWALGGVLNTIAPIVSPRPFAIFLRRAGGPDAPFMTRLWRITA
jgi:hypothetical protein